MSEFSDDIFTEPRGYSVNTLAELGSLTGIARVWEGIRGLYVKPKAEGPKQQAYIERIELQPIDPQTNGPQLFYGLRYHTHITKPDQVKSIMIRWAIGFGSLPPIASFTPSPFPAA